MSELCNKLRRVFDKETYCLEVVTVRREIVIKVEVDIVKETFEL
jgi:hypothetical protein